MKIRIAALAAVLSASTALFAQFQSSYTGATVTGQLHLVTTTNLSTVAITSPAKPALTIPDFLAADRERSKPMRRLPLPPAVAKSLPDLEVPELLRNRADRRISASTDMSVPSPLLTAATSAVGFNALSHYDQRNANSGNQLNVEPPNPSIAVSNGFVLEGVNNAVRVFSTSGTPLTPTASSNQLFGLAPNFNRTTNVSGPFTTDMRVFFDPDINRWFVLQRAQDEGSSGNLLSASHIYLAVSQTADPTAVYNIYAMDTTNTSNFGCPCLDDYPQIGADRYGFYISADEYSLFDPNNPFYNDAVILAISKADLGNGTAAPKASRFIAPFNTGFEFAIQPATTPPGGSPDLASGGVEFFVSSAPGGFTNSLALWAMSNTASIQSASPALLLTQTTVPTLNYFFPDASVPQRSGPLTLGTTLEDIDAGFYSDSRVISTSYAGGRLFATLSTEVLDANHNAAVGGLYVIFSPTLRGTVLSATAPVQQGYLSAPNNHILRPAVAVNPQGQGAIAFTLVGNDYYPSAAFVSIGATSAPSAVQIVGAGAGPEDGFTGYGPIPNCPTCSGNGIARWGDYSTAVANADGSIWFVSEYIPNSPRVLLANWGTYIAQYKP
jgi:hypothetical protein